MTDADSHADWSLSVLFYANENDEPRHIHIKAAENEAKFWMEPIELAWSEGFNSQQLKQIERHIRDNLAYFVEVWDEFFGVSDNDE